MSVNKCPKIFIMKKIILYIFMALSWLIKATSFYAGLFPHKEHPWHKMFECTHPHNGLFWTTILLQSYVGLPPLIPAGSLDYIFILIICLAHRPYISDPQDFFWCHKIICYLQELEEGVCSAQNIYYMYINFIYFWLISYILQKGYWYVHANIKYPTHFLN